MELIEDVSYRQDWAGKLALAAGAAEPETMEKAVEAVLDAVFIEVKRYCEAHEHEDGFISTPIAALMLNASNRLTPRLAGTVRSIQWLHSEALLSMSELDENLQSLRADYGLSVKSDMSAGAAIMIVLQAVYDYFLAVEASREVRLSSPEIAMLDIASRLPAGFERYMPKEA